MKLGVHNGTAWLVFSDGSRFSTNCVVPVEVTCGGRRMTAVPTDEFQSTSRQLSQEYCPSENKPSLKPHIFFRDGFWQISPIPAMVAEKRFHVRAQTWNLFTDARIFAGRLNRPMSAHELIHGPLKT